MTPSPSATRLLLVDDHQVVLHGLTQFFETQDDLVVVGEAGTGERAIGLLEETSPDVAVLS